MAVHFHKLQVKQVKAETPDCVSIAFTIPENLKSEFYKSNNQVNGMKFFLPT